jgi:sugar lactone lactonase YvrE
LQIDVRDVRGTLTCVCGCEGRGHIYVNSIQFGFLAGEPPTAGIIALVTLDGTARQVAGDLAFPNGMVVTPDNATLIVAESMAARLSAFDIAADGSLSNRRVWPAGLGPDGLCLDAEGAIWVGTADVRLASGRDDAPQGRSRGSARAARCRSGSSTTARSSPPCWADRTARRCSCWRPNGAVSSG